MQSCLGIALASAFISTDKAEALRVVMHRTSERLGSNLRICIRSKTESQKLHVAAPPVDAMQNSTCRNHLTQTPWKLHEMRELCTIVHLVALTVTA